MKMSLASLQFTDLLLFEDGSARLKGCPGSGSQLTDIPEDCAQEARELPILLTNAVLTRKQPTVRITHADVQYRVACMEHATGGKVWFMRRLAERVPMLNELGLLPYLQQWLLSAEQCQGLILISGSQASGKTTLASALLAERLTLFGGHAVTFENPAELPLAGPWGKHGHCFQTEIVRECDLAEEIEIAHRYASPDIIFIGEIRNKYAALEALRVSLGSNRQIVMATIHGQNVSTALERLIVWARELDGQSVCQNLANALLAVIHLQLDNMDENTVLRSPEHLLLPAKCVDVTMGVRAKLRDGEVHTLHTDMKTLRSMVIEEMRMRELAS